MSTAAPDVGLAARGSAWKWWVCGLLLLATMINYIDRQMLTLTNLRIMVEFGLNEKDYGLLESAFAYAFALGAIIVGWMADRWNVRWIFPAALFAWSLAGFATGLAQGFVGLLICRFLLGLAAAANWPCALRTTQRLLPPDQRSLGNSILQSGAAVGAILTPLIVLALLPTADAGNFVPGAWRAPFLVAGALGIIWVLLWFPSVRRQDLALARVDTGPSLVNILVWLVLLLGVETAVKVRFSEHPWLPLIVKLGVTALGIMGVFRWLLRATRSDTALPRNVYFRRFGVLIVMVVTINITWHFFRAWLPLFLQKQHGYLEDYTFWFILVYFAATVLGSMTAGWVALYLTQRGLSVHRSRVIVLSTFALLTTLSVVAAVLPTGLVLLGVILVIGCASLGLYPNYYSLTQELTVQHQGKVTGALGCINWLAMALLHEAVGDTIKRTGSYSLGMALAGLTPLVGVVVLLIFWGKASQTRPADASG